MTDLAGIHEALASRLSEVETLRVFTGPQQGAEPPVAWPQFTGWVPADTLSGRGPRQYGFNILVFTSQSVRPADGYRQLMELLEPVALAVWDGNSGTSFAGLANVQARVVRVDVLGTEQIDAFQMYGGLVAVEVTTRP